MRRIIRKKLFRVSAVGAAVLLLAGCGADTGRSGGQAVADRTENAEEKTLGNGQGTEAGDTARKIESGNTGSYDSGSGNSGSAEGAGTETPKQPAEPDAGEGTVSSHPCVKCTEGVPVYGAGDRKLVQEYLEGLPDKYLSFEEAKELGVFRDYSRIAERDLTKKQMKYFQERWLSFYSWSRKAREGTKDTLDKDIDMKDYQNAMVIVRYTVEGDPIYYYLSYLQREGKYFLYVDSSRDNYACRATDYFCSTYEDLRMCLDTEEKTTAFYLVEDEGMSQKKMDKLLERGGYDMDQLFMVYNLGYLVDEMDGGVLCY